MAYTSFIDEPETIVRTPSGSMPSDSKMEKRPVLFQTPFNYTVSTCGMLRQMVCL